MFAMFGSFNATGPFYCAEGLISIAVSSCAVTPALIPVAQLVLLTKSDAAYGFIDSTSYLENSRVFLISGAKDTVVVQGYQLASCYQCVSFTSQDLLSCQVSWRNWMSITLLLSRVRILPETFQSLQDMVR